MANEEMVKNLNSLLQLEIDAVHAYGEAIKNIDDAVIKGRITDFQGDHQKHITDLSEVVHKLGGTPPGYSLDFKGFFIQGFTAIRSATGTVGALKAMETNEKLTNKNYSDALGWTLTPQAKMVVEKNYSDEKRHLEYIQNLLSSLVRT